MPTECASGLWWHLGVNVPNHDQYDETRNVADSAYHISGGAIFHGAE
jgi:hypothetical protein